MQSFWLMKMKAYIRKIGILQMTLIISSNRLRMTNEIKYFLKVHRSLTSRGEKTPKKVPSLTAKTRVILSLGYGSFLYFC